GCVVRASRLRTTTASSSPAPRLLRDGLAPDFLLMRATPSPRRHRMRAWPLLAALPAVCSPTLYAADALDPVTLDRIEVTATRLQHVAPFDVPASFDRIVLDGSEARAGTSVSEALSGVAGLAARERQNFAQDTQ